MPNIISKNYPKYFGVLEGKAKYQTSAEWGYIRSKYDGIEMCKTMIRSRIAQGWGEIEATSAAMGETMESANMFIENIRQSKYSGMLNNKKDIADNFLSSKW